jgi:hypothetical protein
LLLIEMQIYYQFAFLQTSIIKNYIMSKVDFHA